MSAPDEPVLDVQHVVAGYGDRPVLDDVSFSVRRGEIVVVLGGSGSGKSTLLRCIVGLLAPWKGRVLIVGRDVHAAHGREREAILRNVGMSFQSAALLNSMTVLENVALPILEHCNVDPRTAAMLARMRLARVGLARDGDKMPSELSGGMRKRAGLARAMALDPSLLLFDEPSAGLDPITGRELDDLILDLKKEGTMGIVVVTHELGSINTIADRAVMLADGRVLASGPLEEVRAHPDPRVQAFFNRQTLAEHAGADLVTALERPA
ncbi:MAG TPA: ATP-binding cassette domain-containing protein [Candidatus Limnocylindria bacterium]|nr:ATP-binding cassette domain-containing protein [Candidatus Limnocylindria bacterium]